jgi:hypothetical protein
VFSTSLLQQYHRTNHEAVLHCPVRFDEHGRFGAIAQHGAGARNYFLSRHRGVFIIPDIDEQLALGVDSSTLTPCVSSGAVTINMTSRTSMTSM